MTSSELFELVLHRPPMYLGHESIMLAKAFINGYEFAEESRGNNIRDELYVGFQDWIANRFHIRTQHDWASIISFMGGSEAGAFSLAKELWEEYKK
jgi:hypothetical protein